MDLAIHPVNPDFVAEIGDLDLSRPLDAATAAAIKQAFWDYAVLVFPDQHLSVDQHLEFARLFGPLETSIRSLRTDQPQRLRPELADVSNLDPENKLWGEDSHMRRFERANRLWHTDSSFKFLPARASLLYARSIPPVGGHTAFADLRAAYDALSDATRARLDGLIAEHAIVHSRARLGFTDFNREQLEKLPPVPQMMVRTLPENERKTLYLASHAGRIVGLPDAEGRELIDMLLEHAGQRQFVHQHRWRVNDLVMWDDRCTLHRAAPFDDLRYRRDVQRATVSDIANTCEQAGVAVPDLTASA